MRPALGVGRPWWRGVCAAGLVAFAAPGLTTELPGGESAAPVTVAPPPTEIGAVLPAVRLRGFGTVRFLGMAIYDVRLWAGAEFAAGRYETQTFALELQYARKLEGAAIAKRSIIEMRRVGPFDDSRADAWQAAMTRAFPDVAPGDRLTGVHVPGEVTRFFHNGRPTSALADPAFGPLFFGIWLAATTSEPGLRRRLIGSGS